MNRNEITPAMLGTLIPAELEVYILATYRHDGAITPVPTSTPTPTPTPAAVARCVPAILTAVLSQPVTPTPTMYATLVAGVANRYALEVLTTTSYATIEDWVSGEKVSYHPGTTWVVRMVGTSVEVGTHVVYVDGRGDVLTMHASMVDVSEMMRYYAGGMAGDLGASLDTCSTAYDVVAAVCDYLVSTGNDPFYIDGEFVAMMTDTGDYDSPLTPKDKETYVNMWYKSLPADDDAIDCCRGCGFPITPDNSWEHDDDWYCAVCHMDMIHNDDNDAIEETTPDTCRMCGDVINPTDAYTYTDKHGKACGVCCASW